MPIRLFDIVDQHESEILEGWIGLQRGVWTGPRESLTEPQLRARCRDLLAAIRDGLASGSTADPSTGNWSNARDLLTDISREWALQGFSTTETATFVFSLKQPLFHVLRRALKDDPEGLATETWNATLVIDKLGLWTTEVYQKSREQLISRQQEEMLELSTPVVELWEGVLALPLIGTLDSSRTQVVMQNLLEAVVARKATIAIIDITGVGTVDTLVAQHLLKTVAAARLMGADCIISGIRPQIAQTIIHLGVDLSGVVTKATLSDAFRIALRKLGSTIVRN